MRSDRRLHPLSVLFVIGGELGNLLIPGLLVLFAVRRGGGWETGAMWFAIPYAIYAIARHLVTRYAYEPDELVIRGGILSRTERHIRYARVQNVEIVRNPLHRLLSVAEVRVETGGGAEVEARLRVLPLADAEEMRRRVSEGKRRVAGRPEVAGDPMSAPAAADRGAGVPDPRPAARRALGAGEDDAGGEEAGSPPAAREILRLPLRELAIFGLVENRGMLIVSAALGIAWEAGLLERTGLRRIGIGPAMWQALREGAGVGSAWRPEMALALIGILVGFLVAVRVLSVAWAMVQLHGFTLARTGSELRTSCGLLTRVTGVIPTHRIQLLTVSETPLLRLFGRVAVRVETAGGEAQAAVSRAWLAPVLPRERLGALLDQVAPQYALREAEWRPVHPHARHRLMRRGLWAVLIVSLVLAPFVRWWTAPLALPLVLLAIVASRRQAAAMRWTVTPEVVAFRSGWLSRHTSLARHARVQVVTLRHGPFDRRWGMAGVAADTAGGGAHRISVDYLDAEVARGLFAQLEARAAATGFRW